MMNESDAGQPHAEADEECLPSTTETARMRYAILVPYPLRFHVQPFRQTQVNRAI